MAEPIVLDYTKRLKPWFHLSGEERSFIVQKSYRHNFLSSEEVKSYLTSVRINNVANCFFPFVMLPLS